MARRREIDAILVWKLDRYGRSLADLVTTLSELLELGVIYVSLTESQDFSVNEIQIRRNTEDATVVAGEPGT